MITVITIITYVVMAVITHFSLHYKFPEYKFSQSLKSVFDFNTDFFKFFLWFILINIVWISVAVLLNFFISVIKHKND